MEGITVTQEMVRSALQSFGMNGQAVSNVQLFDILGLQSEPEKARMRARVNNMIAHGEVTRVEAGTYTYNFQHRPRGNKSYPSVWRFVRKQKPGWSISDCTLLTRICYTQVLKYCGWLEEEGYIERSGKKNNATAYRATAKADQNPETPWPPLREVDPFAREKAAAAQLARLLLCNDPYAVKTMRSIVEACNILLERFGKPVTRNENEPEKEGEQHV